MAEMAILSTIGSELKSGIQQSIQPLINNANELKQAGLTSLVKSISIAAEPALDVLEILSEEIAPVFQPLFDILSDAIMDELPNIQASVEEMRPQFEELAERIPDLVALLPDIVNAFISFTLFNWEILIKFIEENGEGLVSSMNEIATFLLDNRANFNEMYENWKSNGFGIA
jgi:phage-related protein